MIPIEKMISMLLKKDLEILGVRKRRILNDIEEVNVLMTEEDWDDALMEGYRQDLSDVEEEIRITEKYLKEQNMCESKKSLKEDFYFDYITWLLSLDEIDKLEIEKDDGECPNDDFYEIIIYPILKEKMDVYKFDEFWDMIGREFTKRLDKAGFSLKSDVNMNSLIIPKNPGE
jgi:hypothetical protein